MQTLNQQNPATISMDVQATALPQEITHNLNPHFQVRPYQREAFLRFITYLNQHPTRPRPTQLLFHMATGSGKTLVMAGCLLHLYRLGYRHFIFFVNSSSIIEKTRDNFLNPLSSKYLFAPALFMDGAQVALKEVQHFEAANGRDLHIVFTTIQGLHSRLNTPRENSLTYEDFEDRKIVLLSDEAHHINAETKKGKLSKEEAEAVTSWESTVTKLFHANPDNILLEFTATADFTNPEVKAKYEDKLLFDYPLRQFRKDGYSKEVKVLQAELPPFERAVQAIILSQYRRKVFEGKGKHVKPVLLFKSRSIAESQAFFAAFVQGMKTLDATFLNHLKHLHTDTVLHRSFAYFAAKGITLENLVAELQEDFAEEKCLVVDSRNDSDEKQLLLNSLEEEKNQYRAVFAVDKLNEGWDVLNLFDIVRLYDTRDTEKNTGKIGRTTMSEAQLIGRGARYYPFQLHENQPKYQRKYDDDLENELRICEELYYHASYNPRYISELNKALVEIGIKAANPVPRKAVANTPRQVSPEKEKSQFRGLELPATLRNRRYQFTLASGYTSESAILGEVAPELPPQESHTIKLLSLGHPVLRKAMDRLPFYHFDRLKTLFPQLPSVSEFITSPLFLGEVQVSVNGNREQPERLPPPEKLQIAYQVLCEISVELSRVAPAAAPPIAAK
ncbi:DEAD/DEAH box helicase family protein [Pontibacter mangrovi]|nr:DEAD/DEAH box helicase family protein [Pontibacter mangrovi]